MKKFFSFTLLVALASCTKQDIRTDTVAAATTASDALMPLPFHAISFHTNYPTLPGKVPPFSFVKTQYPDSRIRSIDMLSRAYPNHPSYPNDAFELKGNFTYSTNAAKFVGTKQVWRYSTGPGGTALKTSVSSKAVTYDFQFNKSGYCDKMYFNGHLSFQFSYDYPDLKALNNIYLAYTDELYKNVGEPLYVYNDSEGDPILIYYLYDPAVGHNFQLRYAYSYDDPGDERVYEPTHAYTLEYSLLEIMQWLPGGRRERASVSVNFADASATHRFTQGQQYYHNSYNSNSLLTSYTYGDNVLQQIGWH